MDLALFHSNSSGTLEFTHSAVPTVALASFHVTLHFNIASDYTSNRLELRLSTEPTRRGRARAILARPRVRGWRRAKIVCENRDSRSTPEVTAIQRLPDSTTQV